MVSPNAKTFHLFQANIVRATPPLTRLLPALLAALTTCDGNAERVAETPPATPADAAMEDPEIGPEKA